LSLLHDSIASHDARNFSVTHEQRRSAIEGTILLAYIGLTEFFGRERDHVNLH